MSIDMDAPALSVETLNSLDDDSLEFIIEKLTKLDCSREENIELRRAIQIMNVRERFDREFGPMSIRVGRPQGVTNQ